MKSFIALLLLFAVGLISATNVIDWVRQAPLNEGTADTSVVPTRVKAGENGTFSYVCGSIQGVADFGNFTVEGTDWNLAFLTKYNENGTELWVRVLNTTGESTCYALAIRDDTVIIGGSYQGNVTGDLFEGNEGSEVPIAYHATFDSDGNPIAFVRVGSLDGNASSIQSIEVDDESNIYLAGNFNGSLLLGLDTLESSGEFDVFYAKLGGDNGLFFFANTTGGIGIDLVTDMSTNKDGLSCLTGTFQGEITVGEEVFTALNDHAIWVAEVDGNGTLLWFRHFDSEFGVPSAVFTHEIGHCTAVGFFNKTLAIPNASNATEVVDVGAYFMRFRANGELAVFKTTIGDFDDRFYDVSCDNSNNDCFVAGQFTRNVTLGEDSIESEAEGSKSLFLKLSMDGLVRESLIGTGAPNSALAVDNAGQDAFFAGHFEPGTLTLGDISLEGIANSTLYYADWARSDVESS